MKSRNNIIQLLFVILLFSNCHQENYSKKHQSFQQTESPTDVGFNNTCLHKIDTFFQSNIDKNILPNAVTFVARNGEIVYYKAFGWKDKENNIKCEKNDIFRLASQTKAITTVALMILFEKGYFRMDDPLSKYIPEFKNPQVLVSLNKDTTWTARPAKSEILIKQLLNHTSGICQGVLPDYPIYKKYGVLNPRYKNNLTVKEMVKVLAKLPLISDPGEQYNYGLSSDVAGYLIEVLSGKDLNLFFKDEILDPLGMDDTYFYLPDEKKDRLVKLYQKSGVDSVLKLSNNSAQNNFPIHSSRTYFSGGGGLCGTIEDYAKFCQMLLNGGSFNGKRIISRKTIEMMTRNQIGDLTIWNGDKFGYGFEIIGTEVLKNILGSPGSYKWAGMFGTDYLIDPKENLILLFYTNVHPFEQGDMISHTFRNLVYQSLE